MFDRARLKLDKHDCCKTDLNRIESLVNNGKVDLNTGELRSKIGRYKNMTIGNTTKSIFVTGSWATFYFGNNMQTLSCSQVRLAFEQMSDELQLPLSKANVTQLEFGANLIMFEPITLYIPLLQSYRNYKRNNTDAESVNFWPRTKPQNRLHELAFYDKKVQYRDMGKIIPPEFENQNVLRYEVRLHHSINRQLNVDNVYGAMLWGKEFFDHIGNKWLADYYEVVKSQSNVSLNFENIRTPTNWIEALASYYTVCHNAEYRAVLQLLKENKAFPDPKYYSRSKSKLEKNKYLNYDNSGSLINELDQKVLEALEVGRQ